MTPNYEQLVKKTYPNAIAIYNLITGQTEIYKSPKELKRPNPKYLGKSNSLIPQERKALAWESAYKSMGNK